MAVHCVRYCIGWVSSVQVHGDHIVSAGWDASIKVWQLNTNAGGNSATNFVTSTNHNEKHADPHPHQLPAASASASASASGSSGNGMVSGRCVSTVTDDAAAALFCCRWDPTTNRVLAGSRRAAVHEWDLTTGTLKQTFMGHTKQVNQRLRGL
jgi:WD40 repeat protein